MADRATVGNVEIQAFVDFSPPPFEPNHFFPEVPLEAWGPHKEHLNADGRFQTNFCFFLLRSQGQTILADTGLGAGPVADFGGARGSLMDHLQGAGVKPEDVDKVYITHIHPDHVGWNITLDGNSPRPTFPRARYLIPRGDWDFFRQTDMQEQNPCIKTSVLPLLDLGVMDLVDGDHAITSELSILNTPGHTPGHTSLLITSQGRRGMVLGDVAHSPAQVEEVNWNCGFDGQADLARQTRAQIMDRLEKEDITLAAGHFLFPNNIGKVIRGDGRRYWQPL